MRGQSVYQVKACPLSKTKAFIDAQNIATIYRARWHIKTHF